MQARALRVAPPDLNKLLEDDKFALEAPPGTEVVSLVGRGPEPK